MEPAVETSPAHRRPGMWDMLAGVLLAGTVLLHVIAMFPVYFAGTSGQSLVSQTDQAALYAVLAAAWALALGIGLVGPSRTPTAAAVAVGVAVTELGFRASDLGQVAKYGESTAGPGLWVMEAAWVVGALAAGAAVLAARARHAKPATAAEDPAAAFEDPATDPDVAVAFAALVHRDPSPVVAASERADDEDPNERTAWSLLVAVLALLAAGAFLPAWDHAVATSSVTGRTVSRGLGNAFSGPWQQVVGTVVAAVAMAAVPIVGVRLRRLPVGAGATVGALLVLASQLSAAVLQVDQPVSPSEVGVSAAQAQQLGLHVTLQLTGWFTVDAIAAYLLFAAVLVRATLRHANDRPTATAPAAPSFRSEAVPWGP